MRYRISEVKFNIGESFDVLPAKVAKLVSNKYAGMQVCKYAGKAKRVRLRPSDIKDVEVVRISIDARKNTVFKVCTVDFSCDKKLDLPEPPNTKYEIPTVFGAPQDVSLPQSAPAPRPVVVGFGPCGMFCALVLARAGLKPIVIERGSDVDTRTEKVERFWKTGKLDTECNVQFGEGGAGTFSDGKLNTGIKDSRTRFVLETFADAGADKAILVDARPHIGTDALRKIVKNIRNEVIALGGEVRFDTRFERVILDDAGVVGIVAGEGVIPCGDLVLAIGHSARDTVRSLHGQGVLMEPKAFSMGVRVQHPQALIDQGTYGELAGHPELPPAYYKLSTRASDGRGVYSFCMCPGGEIVNASSQEGGVVTNGMSNHDRDSGFANSGILVDVRPDDYRDYAASEASAQLPDGAPRPDPLSGVAFQEHYEHLAFVNGGSDYSLPETTLQNFGCDGDPVAASLPDFVAFDIAEAMPVFGRKIKGFDSPDTIIKGIESRSSSPVRIVRDRESLLAKLQINNASDDFRFDDCAAASLIKGLYPGGEGAGYAGGITSAAVDGIKIAEKIISNCNQGRVL